MGGPHSCEAGAKTDDMGDGLWVSATFWAAGGFAGVEAGGVLTDEGMACDESD